MRWISNGLPPSAFCDAMAASSSGQFGVPSGGSLEGAIEVGVGTVCLILGRSATGTDLTDSRIRYRIQVEMIRQAGKRSIGVLMLNPVRGPNAGAALAACTAILTLAAPVAAQNEAALKSYFEGNRVTLRLDMPGTSDGVDVQVDGRGVDYQRYGNDLKRYGTSIHVGESVSVTLVKVKRDLIEFQLGGGGFGTFGDDTSTSVPMRLVEKSEREKNLEKRVREEDDRSRRRELQRDLDDLRDRRERANLRITEEHEQAEELKRERIADERLR